MYASGGALVMKTLLDYLSQHLQPIVVVFTLVAVLATVSKKVLESISVLFERLFKADPVEGRLSSDAPVLSEEQMFGGRIRDGVLSPHLVARAQVARRLNDARSARTREVSSAKLSRILSGALTFAQVVIGGVLASSFVQESLPPKTVGLFGVLVLIASLVKQQYRPEVDAEQARDKASKLQALIRFSEDELSTLDARSASGQDRTDALIDLTRKISLLLTAIENPESLPSYKEREAEGETGPAPAPGKSSYPDTSIEGIAQK